MTTLRPSRRTAPPYSASPPTSTLHCRFPLAQVGRCTISSSTCRGANRWVSHCVSSGLTPQERILPSGPSEPELLVDWAWESVDELLDVLVATPTDELVWTPIRGALGSVWWRRKAIGSRHPSHRCRERSWHRRRSHRTTTGARRYRRVRRGVPATDAAWGRRTTRNRSVALAQRHRRDPDVVVAPRR